MKAKKINQKKKVVPDFLKRLPIGYQRKKISIIYQSIVQEVQMKMNNKFSNLRLKKNDREYN